MISSLQDTVTLNNGVKMPGFGLGTYLIPNEEVAEVVKTSIKNGYRLIDTAQVYGNEEGVGDGIQQALLDNPDLNREDLFITTKVWNKGMTKDEAKSSIEESLRKLKLDYVDLVLIHWPFGDQYLPAWQAMEELYEAGKIKAIGVSNFQKHHLENLLNNSNIVPVLNQIELHPKLSQKDLQIMMNEHDIKTEAWSPLMQGEILDNDVLKDLANKYGKSTAQIVLRWDIQNDVLVVVKSTHQKRLIENADVFDFELTDNDMKLINELNEDVRVGPNPDEFQVEE